MNKKNKSRRNVTYLRPFITMLFALVILPVTAQELIWQKCNEALPSSTRIMPVRCHDNNHQEGLPFDSGVEATIDGKLNTNWHTAYYPEHKKVTPDTPAELVYDFEGTERIDRMVYVPRQVGYNGNVTQAEVYVKTKEDEKERFVGHFDWQPDSDWKTVHFQDGIKPLSIRVRILSGVNDLGSCAEMKFLQDDNTSWSSSLFADDLLTKLKDNVTDEDIEHETVPLLRELARQLRCGTYNTTYRVATYECYDSPQWLSEQWKTPGKCYDILQGVTGILMEPGNHLVMVSGLGEQQEVRLKVVAWYTGSTGKNFNGGDPDIQTFHLKNGPNIVEYDSPWSGLAYVSYFSNGHADECPPIRVHFVGGTVNGYLSSDMTNEQMHQMTAAAPSRFIDLVSQKVHAVWTSAGMHEFCKADDGKSPGYRQYMNILDTLMTWEQRLVGFEKYGRIPRNRTLLYVNFTFGSLFQGGLGISSHVDNEPSLLNCQSLIHNESETIWGLSHEWGHQHQVNPYFCWGGMAEVTNNINSYFNVMHMGYRYDQLDANKRKGLENAIKHYIDETTDDCILQSADLFERLCPFLQLYKYFTNEQPPAGKQGSDKVGKNDFFPDLYERLRHSEVQPDSTNVIPYVLNFIRQSSLVSGYDLTPYFEHFGFLRIRDFEIEDYGKYYYHLTQEQLDDFRRSMNALVRKKKLKPMPADMIERIAHTPHVEYERPNFEN
ncbi:MAG: M60 family metallopeptidase [Bacteroidaceae bacterium]|nr:M60 family metallopeptidase [Bacteroidaceae bacterium]